jgi:hypothetical protein
VLSGLLVVVQFAAGQSSPRLALWFRRDRLIKHTIGIPGRRGLGESGRCWQRPNVPTQSSKWCRPSASSSLGSRDRETRRAG